MLEFIFSIRYKNLDLSIGTCIITMESLAIENILF